jgi:hypothetical protein
MPQPAVLPIIYLRNVKTHAPVRISPKIVRLWAITVAAGVNVRRLT